MRIIRMWIKKKIKLHTSNLNGFDTNLQMWRKTLRTFQSGHGSALGHHRSAPLPSEICFLFLCVRLVFTHPEHKTEHLFPRRFCGSQLLVDSWFVPPPDPTKVLSSQHFYWRDHVWFLITHHFWTGSIFRLINWWCWCVAKTNTSPFALPHFHSKVRKLWYCVKLRYFWNVR